MNKTVVLISVQPDLDVVGLKFLHYQLLDRGFDSQLLCLPDYDERRDLAAADHTVVDWVGERAPSFVGISLMSLELRAARRLTKAIKAAYPELPVVWGGVHPSIAADDCVDETDYVVVGEGEGTVCDLAEVLGQGGDPREVRNVCYRDGDRIVRNPLYPLIENLDGLRSYEHIPQSAYMLAGDRIRALDTALFRKFSRYTGITYSVVTTRGCPFSCTYCCNNALSAIYGKKKLRFRSLENIIAELKTAIADNPFLEYVNFQDDCFMARRDEEIARFCEMYGREIGKPFIIRAIPTFVTPDKIASLHEAGLAWVNIGLQSGSDRTCREVFKRKATSADFLRAARIAHDTEVAAYYDVILDNPFETEEDRLASVETFIETPKPFYAQFFSLNFYGGTELRDMALEAGFIRGDEYHDKDYLLYKKIPINHLVRLAAFLPAWWSRRVVALYKKAPDSLRFRVALNLSRVATMLLFEPWASLMTIYLSQHKNVWKTAKVFPSYAREGFRRFMRQFKPAP